MTFIYSINRGRRRYYNNEIEDAHREISSLTGVKDGLSVYESQSYNTDRDDKTIAEPDLRGTRVRIVRE